MLIIAISIKSLREIFKEYSCLLVNLTVDLWDYYNTGLRKSATDIYDQRLVLDIACKRDRLVCNKKKYLSFKEKLQDFARMTQSSERPLSPHLQVYKPQISSILSIMHRMTGVAMAKALLIVTWWLAALAAGPEYYAFFVDIAGSIVGQIVLIGLTFAAFYHLANGIRHMVWDMGYGYELDTMAKTGWTVVAFSLAMTAGTWLVFG